MYISMGRCKALDNIKSSSSPPQVPRQDISHAYSWKSHSIVHAIDCRHLINSTTAMARSSLLRQSSDTCERWDEPLANSACATDRNKQFPSPATGIARKDPLMVSMTESNDSLQVAIAMLAICHRYASPPPQNMAMKGNVLTGNSGPPGGLKGLNNLIL